MLLNIKEATGFWSRNMLEYKATNWRIE